MSRYARQPAKSVEREGMTIAPLRIYFNDKGPAKIA
jgi:tmRNA-binding protein